MKDNTKYSNWNQCVVNVQSYFVEVSIGVNGACTGMKQSSSLLQRAKELKREIS